MSEVEPWAVRHVYSKIDPRMVAYLSRMQAMLKTARDAGWIAEMILIEVATGAEIREALATTEYGEMLIIDMHGQADGETLSLGCTSGTDDRWFEVTTLSSGRLRSSAVILGSCTGLERGGRDAWASLKRGLGRVGYRDSAWFAAFDTAGYADTWPIEAAKAVLCEADGGDHKAAVNALDRLMYDGRSSRWFYDEIRPPLGATDS